MRDEEKYLTIDQGSALLGLKPVTLRMWIARRAIGHVKLGKRAVRIPLSEIQKLVERGYTPALPERAR